MRATIYWFLILAASLGPAGSRAATFEPLDFDQLTARAEQIFIGTVADARSSVSFLGAIVTDFTFVDLEPVKGDAAKSVTYDVRMLGGTVGDTTVAIAGAPTFSKGSRYLVFIEGNGRVMFPTLGGARGIYRVKRDEITGQWRMLDYSGRPLASLPFASGRSAIPKEAVPRADYAPETPWLTRDAFVAEIRKRIGGQP
jgi:hypothetical protein